VSFVDPVDDSSAKYRGSIEAVYSYTSTHMKRLIALAAVTFASQGLVTFAEEGKI
jgi:hypothetical protein